MFYSLDDILDNIKSRYANDKVREQLGTGFPYSN
jgi:hypothetical protein